MVGPVGLTAERIAAGMAALGVGSEATRTGANLCVNNIATTAANKMTAPKAAPPKIATGTIKRLIPKSTTLKASKRM
jgi:hypothetical protein